ncbi:MAG: anti-sigma factor antagonist [Chitinivibrionales bacterium]|nr:anti-sigma factor antagonist [Chitinivibrionales bacterium]
MDYRVDDLGKFKVIRITGNIDTEASSKLLDDEISVLVDKGVHHFLFDLKRTSYLDSAGISIFIHCLCDVQENNGSIYIIADDSQVRSVLEMVGITRLIKTYDNEEAFRAEHVENEA